MNKRMTIAAVSTLGLAGLGLGIGSVAMADPSSSPSTSASPSSSASSSSSGKGTPTDGQQRGGKGEHRGGRGLLGASTQELATKLGVDEAKLTAAIKSVREELPKPTKPDENQTQAQRQAAREAQQKKFVAALATKLGISEQKVTAAITELATQQQASRTAALKTKLDAAVKAGTLTQAEADAVLKAASAGVIDVHAR